jgi:hypothetical protein
MLPALVLEKQKPNHQSRSLKIITKQSVFIVAMSSALVGYVIMSYIMTATPMSMHIIDGFNNDLNCGYNQ